ncbi:hypothetical protein CMEL01_06212, partial [Colletotrichum melonis]
KPHSTGTRLQQQGTRGEVDIGRTLTTKATSLGVGKALQQSNAVGNGCAIRDMIDPTSDQCSKAWSPKAQVFLCSARLMKRLNKSIGAAASRFARPTSFDLKEL